MIKEIFDSLPLQGPEYVLERNEDLLLTLPPHPFGGKWEADEALPVFHFDHHYEPLKFAPPRGVFEGPNLRLEWQNMNGRQPFYHRNTDAEELSFQVCGDRTLMTELGTVELRPGDFSSIPVGVAHDNFGREDVHLLIYLHGPMETTMEPAFVSEHLVPPFEGWSPANMSEATTSCLGGPHCDVSVSMAQEDLLLDAAKTRSERLEVLRPDGAPGETDWIYKTKRIWVGSTKLDSTAPRFYRRHRVADEIQCQIIGTRTLVTQRGTVTLNPGDYVSIPFGCAFGSFSDAPSQHISILTQEEAPPAAEPARFAEMNSGIRLG
ncbi:cupin domain-containing protein [Phaeobacter gallaeciensis]|uniref:Homogentisate 1,2-dioxygenase n=1 Tax=Phaeobacter gallaeciensis TaxID=60890 RepID=A0AAD0EF75_9RHOB|nr:homogentisate 1,2-dioxygenase [Phaeobacter gallaeciensis]AHD11870.1 homogentisate 1,2-dioxygenase [Phaeobacter gallaeciensis DSM 26640]ATE95133.1 homogentisate 1,2-dioxygenase [Phaeobacter gallaeciensis]ATE99441.1 homogentisate 1,2-dioxygenase [Phaeobacter gallaeciensis]ATF03838.1 homogentisate 1,2-dioxygenase [Phaeobacter gallaeciensis]ATF08031.1 homogentisate 1,2-dioxygenase [Phaeobacter gallaeciensis]